MPPEYIYARNVKSSEGLWYADDVFSQESCGSVQYIRSDLVARLLNCDPLSLMGNTLRPEILLLKIQIEELKKELQEKSALLEDAIEAGTLEQRAYGD